MKPLSILAFVAGFGSLALIVRALRAAAPSTSTPIPSTGKPAPMSQLLRDALADHTQKSANLELLPDHAKALESFASRFRANAERYLEVARKVDMPAELIAALHERESGGLFDRYLHNGDPLGKPTTHVPKGKMFSEWEPAAVDALMMFRPLADTLGVREETDDLAPLLTLAEQYNGFGYRKKGLVSPYIYSGTNVYKGGKFTGDGHYDPNVKDQQLGVAEMLLTLKKGWSR